METPKSSSTTTPINNNSKSNLLNPTSDSPAFQDSPVFNYLSNLSPIQPVKAGSVAQGFPGLASPPLVFTSPLINSQTRFFSRKLQSSGSNSEFPQDHEKPKLNEKDLNDSLKLDPEFPSPPIDHQKTCNNTEKLLQMALCTPSSGFDDLLPDPGQRAKSSHETQSCDVLAPVEEGFLEKKDDGNGKDGGPGGSVVQKGKEAAQLKSRISFKLVKNEPRRLISSPECSGALPRLLTEHNSENFQTGESFSEASHSERGTLRRCLFDESQKKNTAAGSAVWNPIASGQISKSASISTEKSVSRKVINLCKPVTSTCVSPVPGNNPVANSKPLGIGLHLNSVVYPRSTDNTIGSQQSSLVKIEGKSSLFVINSQPNEKVDASNVTGNVVASSEEIDQHQACIVPTSDKAIASVALELFNDAIEASLDACSTSTHGNNKLNSNLSEYKESGLVILSPKKKRKRASSSTDDETNKRCNCRKTKCLKLYCDCFAAGFYCGESCACQGCFNRPENKDTVLETRQQIESRNPLAFAPKIVQPVSGVPATIEQEVGTLSTPSSARHKRGCNCKKSMCLKKYCECYQANVGCSDGCRCEGCKNIYGTREDHSLAREVMIKTASLEMSEGTMMDNCNLVSSREHNSLKLTPITPSLQCSDQRKNALQSRLPFKRFLRTPDSQHDILTYGVSLSQKHGVLPEKIESKDVGALETEKGSENTEDRLVPVSDEYKYAPCSFQSSNNLAKDTDSKKIPLPHSFAESVPTPSSNSLRWRSSPITPITEVATCELKDFEAGVKLSDLFEDETPDILKQSYSPNKSVKMSSPNKKRISPPHKHMISSESLTCSRKFVLRAVPSFPSLTPCSKSSSNDNRGQSSK